MEKYHTTSPGADKVKDNPFDIMFNANKDFPVRVYPDLIQQFIEAANIGLNFPIEYFAASILFAISIAIGNSIRAEVVPGWHESAVLYLAIVGNPGTSKSHPLSFVLKPIEDRDRANYEIYKKQKTEYDESITLTKKERAANGMNSFPIKPVWKQNIVSDATPEALAETHKHNQRGVVVANDELAAWIKNFDRYNKGSEQEFFLSVWSNKAVRINRKTSEPTYLPLPFISICGTIQPSVMADMLKNRTENGFIDRILFVFPDRVVKKPWSKGIDPQWPAFWYNILTQIMDLPFNVDDKGNPQPRVLKFAPDGMSKLKQWQAELTRESNRTKDEALMGILAKIEVYAIRFAICLEVLKHGTTTSPLESISLESVNGAIKLAEYFKENALKVQQLVSKRGLPGIKETILLLNSLNHSQSEIARILKISQPYVSRIINQSA
jgi:hypothetical protein